MIQKQFLNCGDETFLKTVKKAPVLQECGKLQKNGAQIEWR